jgi:hypothetical protein
MKIYIENLDINNLNINNLNIKNIELKLHKSKTIYYKNIYSENGIFRLQDNNLSQIIPVDVHVEKMTYNNELFFIDKSYYNYINNIYCIPYKHKLDEIFQDIYKLNVKSKISLVVEYNQTLKKFDKNKINEMNNIIDIYFSTNEKNLDKNLKDNIIEYCSLINYIKQS